MNVDGQGMDLALGNADWQQGRRRALAERFLLFDDSGAPEGFIPYTFPIYQPDPFHHYLAHRLERFEREVMEKRSPRLMIFAPPQTGKSELVSRRFPAWVLGRHPHWRIILASYGAELAEEMSGDVRDTIRGEEYAELFGALAVEDPSEAIELSRERKGAAAWRIARHRGGMAAVGVGGAITGRAAEILIVDDPVKGRREADSETYREDAWKWWPQARDRVQKGGGILFICTRWHHDDLAGRLLDLGKKNPAADQWEVLEFKAIAEENDGPYTDPLGRAPGEPLAPGRYDIPDLLMLKATVGSREWSAKFQQRPTDDQGAIFLREWWRYDLPERANPRVKYQFWDLAFSRSQDADWSVCVTLGVERGPLYRVLDVYRARLTFPEAKRAVRRLHDQHKPVRAIVVEKKGREDSQYKELRRDSGLPLLWYVPDRDKVQRAHAVTPLIESGAVYLPDHAPWKEDFLEELSRFPAAPHDDQVDAFTMGLICLGVRSINVRGATVLRDFRVVA